ncbi:MAG: putative toxin-antitoxin system toxin component, PIN family [Actinomycetia bacterium]|nr:putative toxin-antitoxin system toxin component, PIN family [Actinomycetes bacterium]
MKVVIDTNVFISSFLNQKGNPKKIIDLWKKEEITICTNKEILQEYMEVLARLGLSSEPEFEELVNLFKKKVNMLFFPNTPSLDSLCDDPDDNKFLECASAADAAYIISGGKHLLRLIQFKEIKILNPKDFLAAVDLRNTSQDG